MTILWSFAAFFFVLFTVFKINIRNAWSWWIICTFFLCFLYCLRLPRIHNCYFFFFLLSVLAITTFIVNLTYEVNASMDRPRLLFLRKLELYIFLRLLCFFLEFSFLIRKFSVSSRLTRYYYSVMIIFLLILMQ